MIQIKKSKYDNYCTCCRRPFDDSMEVSFSHKDYNDSVNITLCGKCRRELMEALSKTDSNSALDHIHNVVAEREYQRGYKQAKEEYDHKLTEIKSRIKDHYYNKGYEQGKADANCPEIPDSWIPVTKKMPEDDGEYFVLYDEEYAENYDTGRVGVADFYVDCEAFGYWQQRYDPVSLGFVDCDFTEIKVKKWMPIPKEEGEADGA